MAQPVIGITLDSEPAGGYSNAPWYALRENYADAITMHGGTPILLPHDPKAVPHYLELVDGLIFTGGDFDIDPSMYGDDTIHETTTTKDKRTIFEVALLRGAIKQNIPLLGICAGEQLLNVLLGGTLIQHIPDEIENPLEHEQRHLGIPQGDASHDIAITEGTLLHKIVGSTSMKVNSSHHQAVKTVGANVVINATAPDGVIEGIEYTKHPFCLGVEWHPEYTLSDGDNNIIKALIAASHG